MFQRLVFGFPYRSRSILQPFFIVGSGRSGNTLLRRILFSHQDLHIPPENHGLATVIRTFPRIRRQSWSNVVLGCLNVLQSYEDFKYFEVDLSALNQKLISAPYHYRSLAFIVDQLYRHEGVMDNTNVKRWGDKTPLNIFYINDLLKVFPASKFIHMIRDATDVVESYLRMGRYSTVEEAANRWRSSVQFGRSFGLHHPDAYLEIRYEELVTDPRLTILNICRFLKIEYSDDLIDSELSFDKMGDTLIHDHYRKVRSPISIENIGLGRSSLSENQMDELFKVAGGLIRELGYE